MGHRHDVSWIADADRELEEALASPTAHEAGASVLFFWSEIEPLLDDLTGVALGWS
jgi:hypothetical protein